jgi:hypothetical protein
MSLLFKRVIPMTITFIVGILVICPYYIDIPVLKTIESNILNWGIIMSSIALGIGAINVFILNTKRLRNREGYEWLYGGWVLFIFMLFIVIGILFGTTSETYNWIYNNIFLPTGSTMYASTMFYLASALYRTFRVRNVESGFLLISALIIILWSSPIIPYLFPPITDLGTFINDVFVVGAFRTIVIGIGLASFYMSIKVLVGIEKGYLGAGEE